jgi:hypothetical protein
MNKNCEHKFISKIISHQGWFGAFSEEILIYCENCGKTPKEIMAEDTAHQHKFDIK